jgi:hypothetical protein
MLDFSSKMVRPPSSAREYTFIISSTST